jgi:prephenate dehydrogenase
MGLSSKLKRPKIGIVGGTGRMGTWFADFLERAGLQASRVGQRTDLTAEKMVRQCHVVVVSVPVTDTVNVIRQIGPLVAEEGLLMDLTSVKKEPLEAMLKYSRSEVVGIHPLFGPDVESNSGLKVVVVPGRGVSGQHWITNIFLKAGFRVAVLGAEEHDRMMGLIQGVNHFSTLSLALCISRSGIEIPKLLKVTTQTFLQRVARVRSILEQPPGLFASLLMDNPSAGKFMEQYLESVESLIQITRNGDREAFGELFVSLKKVFDKES